MAVNLFQRNNGSEEIPEGTTFSSDEIATDEESGVDLIEDIGSVTRTREGDPLAGSRGPLERFKNFATRSDELPQSIQAPARVDPARDDEPEAWEVTSVNVGKGGGTTTNETATAATQGSAEAVKSLGETAASTAESAASVGENLDLLVLAVLGIGAIVALGNLFDFGVDVGEVTG